MDVVKLSFICLSLIVLPTFAIVCSNPDLVSEVDREGEMLYFACFK